MRRLRNLGRLTLGAVVAPQVVVIQWLHMLVHRHHRRPRRIERNRHHRLARHPGLVQHLPRSRSERPHVVRMGLGGKLRILRRPMQRILRHRRCQHALHAIHHRRPPAQRPKIHSHHNRHGTLPESLKAEASTEVHSKRILDYPSTETCRSKTAHADPPTPREFDENLVKPAERSGSSGKYVYNPSLISPSIGPKFFPLLPSGLL